MINRIIQIWVGPHEPPAREMLSWTLMNPGIDYRAYGVDALNRPPWAEGWVLRPQMDVMIEKGWWHGVSDLMRYELLSRFGGLYLDADFTAVRPLADLPEYFLVYENEIAKPGLICNGVMKPTPEFASLCFEACNGMSRDYLLSAQPWETTGPKLVTRIAELNPRHVPTILPARSFLPKHYTGIDAPGDFKPFATHSWGTTLGKQ